MSLLTAPRSMFMSLVPVFNTSSGLMLFLAMALTRDLTIGVEGLTSTGSIGSPARTALHPSGSTPETSLMTSLQPGCPGGYLRSIRTWPLLEGSRKRRIVVIDERGRKRVIEGGYTGRIERCHIERIRALLEIYRVLVVSPLVLDRSEGLLLNTDGDEAAASIASCTRAGELVFATDVPGVVIDGGVVREVRAGDRSLLEKTGAGMNRKLMAAYRYVAETGGRAYICDGSSGDVFEKARRGECTVVSP